MVPGYAPELHHQKEPANELVQRIAKDLRGAGFKVDTAVEVGSPGNTNRTLSPSIPPCNCDGSRTRTPRLVADAFLTERSTTLSLAAVHISAL